MNDGQQLRYAVQLIWQKEGVLLIDSIDWIVVYYNGLINQHCVPLCKLIQNAISSCANLLSYEPSALKCTPTVPCQHEHTLPLMPFHPTELGKKQDSELYISHCPLERNLSEYISDPRQTCWLTSDAALPHCHNITNGKQ